MKARSLIQPLIRRSRYSSVWYYSSDDPWVVAETYVLLPLFGFVRPPRGLSITLTMKLTDMIYLSQNYTVENFFQI